MKSIHKLMILGGTFALAQCSTLPKAPTEVEFAVAQKKWTEVKMEDITDGHTIYTTRCNTCHGLKKISDYDEATWGKLIDAMAPNAKLTAEETGKLRKYIYSAREVGAK